MNVKVAGSGSSGNSYVVHLDDGTAIVLDLGCPYPVIQKAAEYKIKHLRFAVVTHEHKDHCCTMDRYCNMGVKVFCNQATRTKTGSGIVVYPMQTIKRAECEITPFEVPHTKKDPFSGEIGPCQNYGWLIVLPTKEKLLYVTDFEYIKYNFKKLGINYFILECNHVDDEIFGDSRKRAHVLRGHSSLKTVKEFLAANYTAYMRNVILCHLSADNADPELMVSEVQQIVGKDVKVDIARAGETIELAKLLFRRV